MRTLLAIVTILAPLAALSPWAHAEDRTQVSRPAPGLEIWWSPASDHATTGVTVHVEVLAGLESEGVKHLGRTATLAAWLHRSPLPQTDGLSLQEMATRSGVDLQSDVDWRHAAISMWGPESSGELLLWLAAARLESPSPPVSADALREGLDSLSGRWQDDAVGPMGNGFDTIRRYMLGLQEGSTRLTSYLHATRLEDDALVRVATEAASSHPARIVVVAAPRVLSHLRDQAATVFSGTAPRPEHRRHEMTPRREETGPRSGRIVQQYDSRRRLLVAWDLAPGVGEERTWPLARTAALLALTYWARHPGASLPQALVTSHGLAIDIEARAWLYPTPALAVEATSRNQDMGELRARLTESLEGLVTRPLSTIEARAAATLARNWLAVRWDYGPDRARLIGELAGTGVTDPDAWLEQLNEAFDALRPEDFGGLQTYGLHGEGRRSLAIIPREEIDVDRVRLDADQIAMYLRLVVDLRCPPPGAPRDISTLLRQKYNMAPRRYVAITRALAANPALLRDLSDEAEGRCQELAKLRAVLPGDRVVGLHEAVLCGPGVTPVTRRAKRKLARIWRRFDVDSSWYRPLLLATREDPAHTEALLAIDRRCSTAEEVQP